MKRFVICGGQWGHYSVWDWVVFLHFRIKPQTNSALPALYACVCVEKNVTAWVVQKMLKLTIDNRLQGGSLKLYSNLWPF